MKIGVREIIYSLLPVVLIISNGCAGGSGYKSSIWHIERKINKGKFEDAWSKLNLLVDSEAWSMWSDEQKARSLTKLAYLGEINGKTEELDRIYQRAMALYASLAMEAEYIDESYRYAYFLKDSGNIESANQVLETVLQNDETLNALSAVYFADLYHTLATQSLRVGDYGKCRDYMKLWRSTISKIDVENSNPPLLVQALPSKESVMLASMETEAFISYKEGQLIKALGAYQGLITYYNYNAPDDKRLPVIYFHFADLLAQAGRTEEARRARLDGRNRMRILRDELYQVLPDPEPLGDSDPLSYFHWVPYDTRPEPIGGDVALRKRVKYPRKARAWRIEGEVIVHAYISKSGWVTDITIMQGIGIPMFNEPAMEAVQQTRFKPATITGRPVAVWINIPIRFALAPEIIKKIPFSVRRQLNQR